MQKSCHLAVYDVAKMVDAVCLIFLHMCNVLYMGLTMLPFFARFQLPFCYLETILDNIDWISVLQHTRPILHTYYKVSHAVSKWHKSMLHLRKKIVPFHMDDNFVSNY